MEFSYIQTQEELSRQLKELEGDYIFLDIETTQSGENFRKGKVRLIQLGDFKKALVVDLFFCPDCVQLLREFLNKKAWVGHNLKFDIKYLYAKYGIEPITVFDTYIASILLGNERNSLQAVVEKYLGEYLDKTQQLSNWGTLQLNKEQIEYAAKDIIILRRIFPILLDELNKQDFEEKKILLRTRVAQIFKLKNPIAILEMALVKELAKMEAHGFKVDSDTLKTLSKKLKRQIQNLQIQFMTKYGKIDIFSPKQVATFLTKKLKISLPKTKRGNVTTDDKTLSQYLNIEPVAQIVHIRKLKKNYDKLQELEKYIDKETSRVYAEFKQIGAKTGRMSSSNPNLQNIPRSMRNIFIAEEGHKLVIADFSQIELRIAAEYVEEEKMIEAFKRGEDMHIFTASLVLGKPKEEITKEERQLAKAMNYGLIYGIGPKGLMEYARFGFGVNISLEEAKNLINRFFEVFTNFRQWHQELKTKLRLQGKIEGKSLLGRKYIATTFQDSANYPIQSTGADLLKLAVNIFMYQCNIQGFHSVKLVNLVHDEIVCEVPEKEAEEVGKLLKESMEFAGSLILKKVPVVADVVISDKWEK